MGAADAGWALLGAGCIAGGLAWGWRDQLAGRGKGRENGREKGRPPFDFEAAPPPERAVGAPGVEGRLSAGALARSSSLMAAGTALSRASGLFRVLALAFVLGGGRLADAFNLANTTPNSIYELVAGGVLSAALVPVFVDWLNRGDDRSAGEAMSAVLTTAAAVLVAGTLLTALAAPAIVGLYNLQNHTPVRGAEQRLATELLWLFAPQVLFYGLASLAEGVLTARRRFGPPKFVPIVNNVVAILVLVALRQVMTTTDAAHFRHHAAWVVLLGAGTTAGVGLQVVWLLPYLRNGAGRLRLVWQPAHPAVLQVLRLAGWAFGWVVANQLAWFFVAILANGQAGGFTAYSYAWVFFQLPYAVVAVSLMTAFLPELSEAWAAGDRATFGRQAGRGLRMVAVVVVPAAAVLFVLARPGLELVLAYGSFKAAAPTTADVLSVLALGLPGFCAFAFLVRAFSSMQDTRTPFFLYVLENGLNVVLAIPLYQAYGVRGLAGALALAYTAAAGAGAAALRWKAGRLEPGLGRAHLRLAAAAAGAVVAMAVVAHIVEGRGTATRLVDAGAGAVAGVTVFIVAAQAMGATELGTLVSRFRRR